MLEMQHLFYCVVHYFCRVYRYSVAARTRIDLRRIATVDRGGAEVVVRSSADRSLTMEKTLREVTRVWIVV